MWTKDECHTIEQWMLVRLQSNIAAKGLKRSSSYRDFLLLFNISFQLETNAFIENEALGSIADILLIMSLLISTTTTHNGVGLHVLDTVNPYNMKVKCTVYLPQAGISQDPLLDFMVI
jgi:uncharacterized membrane protein YbjE (DUF340 family)